MTINSVMKHNRTLMLNINERAELIILLFYLEFQYLILNIWYGIVVQSCLNLMLFTIRKSFKFVSYKSTRHLDQLHFL